MNTQPEENTTASTQPSRRLSLRVNSVMDETIAVFMGIVGRVAPFVTPIPEAMMTARALVALDIDIGMAGATVIAAAIEVAGISIQAHWLTTQADIARGEEPAEAIKGPRLLVWANAGISLTIIGGITAVDIITTGNWAKLLNLAFPLASILGTLNESMRAQRTIKRAMLEEEEQRQAAEAIEAEAADERRRADLRAEREERTSGKLREQLKQATAQLKQQAADLDAAQTAHERQEADNARLVQQIAEMQSRMAQLEAMTRPPEPIDKSAFFELLRENGDADALVARMRADHTQRANLLNDYLQENHRETKKASTAREWANAILEAAPER